MRFSRTTKPITSRARKWRRIAITSVVVSLTIPAIANATIRSSTEPYGGPKGNGQHTLLVVGDSLTEGAAVFGKLRDRLLKLDTWTNVIIDYRYGRRGPEGIVAIRERLKKNPNITAVIFALGTNDLLSRRYPTYPKQLIDQYNAEFSHIPTLWIDAQYNSTHPDWNVRARRYTRALVAASASQPNMYHASWFRFFDRKSPWYQFDGLHLSPRGYRIRTNFIVQQARQFGPKVVDSSTTTTTPTTSAVPPEEETTTTTTLPLP